MRISDWSSDVCSSDLARCQYYFIAIDDVVAVPVYPAPHGSGGLARSFAAGAQRRGEFAIGEGVGAECRAIGLSRGGRTPDGGTVRPGGRAADPGCQSPLSGGPACQTHARPPGIAE